MTDEELRYRMERVTERMAGADDTNEVVVSVALMRELFGRLEQMQAKIDAVPVGAIAAALDKSEIGASDPEDYVFYKQLVAWLSDIHGSGYEFMKGWEL